MGKFFLGFLGLLLISVGVFYYFYRGGDFDLQFTQLFLPNGSITISSEDFTNGGSIPSRYTCDGEDISPELIIRNVPIEAKSLVLLMEDSSLISDHFTHWISYNLSPDTNIVGRVKVLGNADTGVNDFGKNEYDGPCPPAGEKHKYVFRVYAMDETLDLRFPRRDELNNVISGHIIAVGSISGVYSRNP